MLAPSGRMPQMGPPSGFIAGASAAARPCSVVVRANDCTGSQEPAWTGGAAGGGGRGAASTPPSLYGSGANCGLLLHPSAAAAKSAAPPNHLFCVVMALTPPSLKSARPREAVDP